MKKTNIHMNKKNLLIVSATVLCFGLTSLPSVAEAATAKASTTATTKTTTTATANTTSTTSSTSLTSTQKAQHLATIKQKGDQEISRRLSQLNKLDALITSSSHLSNGDQTYLSGEVSTEISGLQALETQLNGETTLTAAITDAQNIISEYRVYALVTPKVYLVKTADDEQSVDAKLTTLATKLQSRINADENAGKNTSALQSDLNAMTADTSKAQTIASSIETSVLPLQPVDYNTDHTVLSGDQTSLQTARSDNTAATNEAQNIVSGLKALES